MVKRQREKQYQSRKEHKQYSQSRSGSGQKYSTVQRRLPFNCCALTLTPFTDPVCTKNCGVVFDSSALTNFVLKHKRDPVSGKSATTRDIITLHMDQDEENRWQCPVMTKPFSDHTKIVAVLDREANEAYVYSYDSYNELNVKAKNWVDLTTGKKFNPKKDVLILNDPENAEFQQQRDIQSFWYIQNGRSADLAQQTAGSTNVKHSVTATRIMEEINKKREASGDTKTAKSKSEGSGTAKKPKIFAEDVTGIRYTSGRTAGSLTSTAMDVAHDSDLREASKEEILQARFKIMKIQKQKGYVRFTTNMGDLLLELHCDIAPRTCTNFLGLCRAKKYESSAKCHRLIPGFMVQLGKSQVGEDASIWGPAFEDEFDDRLKHTGSGTLSMANAGPNTNKRQFFITFKACPHLDRKHTVFGQVVDGQSVLEEIQKMETDKKDRPIETLKILKTEILVDPALEAEELEDKRLEELAALREKEKKQNEKPKKKATNGDEGAASANKTTSGVGKYLKKANLLDTLDDNVGGKGLGLDLPKVTRPVASKKAPKTKFGDFSGW